MARYSIRHFLAAIDELKEAANWYTEQDPKAGSRLIAKVKAKFAEIRVSPRRWSVDRDGTQHALLGPFKYKIVFREHKGVIQIIAYAHTSRRPGYWRKRLRKDSDST